MALAAPISAVASDSVGRDRGQPQHGSNRRGERDGAATRDTAVGAGRTRRTAAAKPAWFSKPRWVMLRSLLVPGWGQAYNHAWLKAGLVAAGEGTLVALVVNDQRALSRLERDVGRARGGGLDPNDAITAYNDRLSLANTREYLLGVVVVYSLVDAYVDAHFRNFKIEFETDPALEGRQPNTGARVGWELRF